MGSVFLCFNKNFLYLLLFPYVGLQGLVWRFGAECGGLFDVEVRGMACARSEFWEVASRVPWGWRDSYGKWEILVRWVTKVFLKCTKNLG